tara:strand:- start:276 stop:458 length:183 start_codon:yes stop_codon:yes gene_type:complete
MNEVQIGTEVKIKNSDLKGRVVEVFHFPTTFKVEFEDGKFEVFKTHEVELLKNEIKEEDE